MHFLPIPLAVFICSTALTSAFQALPLQSYILPLTTSNTSNSLTTAVGASPLDGVSITAPTMTSHETWSFTALATDLSTSITIQSIVNYTSSPTLTLAVQISLANGTLLSLVIPSDRLFVSTLGEGSKASAANGSYGWWSRPEIGEYEIEFRLEEKGVLGRVRLQSVAPPHVACGPAIPGASLALHAGLFWSNLIPDAVAQVELVLDGERVSFLGIGYHDKTWGSSPIPSTTIYLRGHGRAGQWSVVWHHFIDSSDPFAPFSSIYIARQGEIVYASCTGVEVRPFMLPGPYPASAIGMNVSGYSIEVDAGLLGRFEFVARAARTVGEECIGGEGGCGRWIGEFEGGFVEAERDVGVALWELIGSGDGA